MVWRLCVLLGAITGVLLYPAPTTSSPQPARTIRNLRNIDFTAHVDRAPQSGCTSYTTYTLHGTISSRIQEAAEIETVYVSRVYHTPCAEFGADGTPVYVKSSLAAQAACGPGAASCHGITPSGQPYAIVDRDSLDFIHEIIETTTDPVLANDLEICDQYEGYAFTIDGVHAPAFELPDGRMWPSSARVG